VIYYVYMLKSKSIKTITYVGYTKNLEKRVKLHNSGKGAKFTRGRKWVLIYKEKYKSKKEAISREYYIKYNRTLRNKIKNEYINSVTL
jgi:putative endonuclease